MQWLEEVKEVLLKSKDRLTEIGLFLWVILELIYNVFYFNVSTPAPLIVEFQFLLLAISFANIRNKMQKNYFKPIIAYYTYTIILQILIYTGLDNRQTIHIVDFAVFAGCLLALIFTVIKIR